MKKEQPTIGRRKEAIAQISLTIGTGKKLINKKSIENYFQHNLDYINTINSPLNQVKSKNSYDLVVSVTGGGLVSQANAIKLAIARSLCKINIENRLQLKPIGFLTCDARVKERKKYGLKKARKASQFSKR
uniref:ribosomal protein S9 n=1 Tax=Haramonas pauciplastida TaxID=478668 RepID=UPI002113E6A5|nr:ribosomal protein S9 [Haramonas pauciplastida]UTE94958.1 ribosomal protein S9 [Haramonas pauciplastida]